MPMTFDESDRERKFAEKLIDDLRVAEDIQIRDAADTGARLTFDELIRGQGFDPADFDV